MLDPIYAALLQAAMRHVPDGTLTIDMREPISQDGRDLIINNKGSAFTATLVDHDQAVAQAAEWSAQAEYVTTDPDSGARLMMRRADRDDDDAPPTRRGLVERFRAARDG